MISTTQLIRLLSAANPGRRITEDTLRFCLRRGDVAPPSMFAGRYAWSYPDAAALAAALSLEPPSIDDWDEDGPSASRLNPTVPTSPAGSGAKA